ncbi:MAG: hypothetical protein AAGA18_07950 [Verrucomicrobiota bacterium]
MKNPINTTPLKGLSSLEGVRAVIAFDKDGCVIYEIDHHNSLAPVRNDLIRYLLSLLETFKTQKLPVTQSSFEFANGSFVLGASDYVVIGVLVETDVSVPFVLRSLNVILFKPSSRMEITDVKELEEEAVPKSESIPKEEHFTDREEVLNGTVTLSRKFWKAFDKFMIEEFGEEKALDVLEEALTEIGYQRSELRARDFDRLISLIAAPIKTKLKRSAFKEECHHLLFNSDQ